MKPKSNFIIFLFIMLSVSQQSLNAQQTGFGDSFDDTIRASVEAPFKLLQENGKLRIDVNKPQSIKWQGVDYTIDQAIDISANPFMNIKFKSDTPLLLTIYIQDEFFANTTKSLKIYSSEYFVDYFIDFTNATRVNKSRITKLRFVPNGNSINAFKAVIFFDEISIGSEAAKLANIGASNGYSAFVNSTNNKFNLFDIRNTENLITTGAENTITNIRISDVASEVASITFDCVEGFIGEEILLVTANGIDRFENNTIKVPIIIERNFTPHVSYILDQETVIGDTSSLILLDINDGNETIEQPLTFTVYSNNQTALPDSNLKLIYDEGSTIAELFYVTNEIANDIEVTIEIDDQHSENNLNVSTFLIDSYSTFNKPPTIDFIQNEFVYLNSKQQSILLTGISDGSDDSQELSFSVISNNNIIIPTDSITIDYTQGDSTAILNFTTLNTGTSNITISIEDNGGTEFNNGNTIIEIQFNIEVGIVPLNGHTADFTSFNNWGLDYNNSQQDYELGSFHGKDNVLKISLVNKTSWTGTIYNSPELNLDEHRYVSYEIYFEGDDFGFGIGGRTHCYFYDDGWDAEVDRNLPAAHSKRQAVTADKWETIFMDFRSKGGMNNSQGEEINVTRIQKILLNYASSFDWPFPSDNGNVYIANLRIGDAVPDSLIPEIESTCTINPIPTQTIFRNTETQIIQLRGITNGNSESIIPTLTIESSDTSFIPNPVVSSVQEDGSASLTYKPASITGRVSITIGVSAEGSLNKSTSFYIDVVNETLSDAADIELFSDSLYQTIRGFGTFYFPSHQNYLENYTIDLGASAVRIGIIENQIEPVNDNDNPNELNLDGFNYDAFDFNYLKRLKEGGVETFILTSWSPPAWMKKNLSVDYGFASAPNYNQTDNKLEQYYFDEFAESMVAVVKMFQIKADINLYAIGIQNEPAFNEPYASAILDPPTFSKLVGIVGKRFEEENITTKLYMPEQVFFQGHYPMSEYISSLVSQPEAEKYVDIIATHSYGDDGIVPGQPSYPNWSSLWNQSKQTQHSKELWMSETFPEGRSWDDALSLAGAIHGALKFGNVSLWTLWQIESSLMKNNSKLASFFTSQNYYKFIRPGAKRIKVESDNEDILVTSFLDEKNQMLTTVMINKNSMPITVRLLAHTATVPATYEVYTSAKYFNFNHAGNVGVNETIALPGKSVTTFVGKTDGEMVIDVKDEEQLPTEYMLYNNYPNPFNPTTTIKYSLKNSSDVKLFVYDILGREVKHLVNTQQNAGTYHVNFNATEFASGVYFYRLQAGDFSITKKLILLK